MSLDLSAETEGFEPGLWRCDQVRYGAFTRVHAVPAGSWATFDHVHECSQ